MQRINYTGQTLENRYIIENLLGEGGMGAVYLARHLVLGKPVAVKFLHAEFAGNEEIVRRFYREGQAAVSIRHKNVIDILDVGVSKENEPYLVMEYLEGESLADMLTRTGPIRLPAACAVLEPVLMALQAAHDNGIVHRDLKPDNIFLASEKDGSLTVKLIDFGISKLTAPNQPVLTKTGALVGTPAFMAPEQIVAAKSVDHRTDIYAIGIILYQMLTGCYPFEAEHYESLIYRVVADDPIPPETAYPKFPKEATGIVMQCMSKDPADRPQSADALIAQMAQLTDYQHRKKQLKEYSSGVMVMTVAGGSIGAPIRSSGPPVAADVLAELTPKTDWNLSGSVKEKETLWQKNLWIGGAVAVLLLAGLGLVFWGSDKGSAKGTLSHIPVTNPSVDAPPIPVSKTVKLDISGAPPGALFSFKNRIWKTSPLIVERSDKMETLSVTAPGFSPWKYAIVPNKDYTLIVTLQPLVPSIPDVAEQKKAAINEAKKTESQTAKPPTKAKSKDATPSKDRTHPKNERQLPKGYKSNW